MLKLVNVNSADTHTSMSGVRHLLYESVSFRFTTASQPGISSEWSRHHPSTFSGMYDVSEHRCVTHEGLFVIFSQKGESRIHDIQLLVNKTFIFQFYFEVKRDISGDILKISPKQSLLSGSSYSGDVCRCGQSRSRGPRYVHQAHLGLCHTCSRCLSSGHCGIIIDILHQR